jgi:glycolate oxidase iron-sulfur subunit
MKPNINSARPRASSTPGRHPDPVADEAGCCGAIRLHLDDHVGAHEHMRRNIDAWWPLVSTGAVEAIVMNASGCGVTVKEYGRSLARDPGLRRQGAAHRRADPRRVRAAPDIVESIGKALPRSAGSGEGVQP